MKSVELDLGGLEIKSKASDVQLRLSSHAAFAPSAEDDVAALLERLTCSERNNNSITRPWITCDNTFQLQLSLSLGPVLSGAAREELIDVLAERLRTTKSWKHLGLTATSVEATSSSNECHLIKIDLVIRQRDAKSTPRRLHKLPVPPSLDTRPPPGICTAALREVRIDLHIQRSEVSCQTKPKRRRIVFGPRAGRSGVVLQRGSYENAGQSCMPSDNGPYRPDTTTSTLPVISGTEWLLNSDDKSDDLDEELLLAADVGREKIVDTDGDANFPSLPKRSSSGLDLDFNKPTTYHNDILDLLDAATRMAILGSRGNLPKSVSVTGTESLRCFDALIPSIWRPEYSRVVEGRAVFLPTISHALGSVYHSNVNHGLFKDMFDGSNGGPPHDVVETRHKTKSMSPPADLSARLWQKLQATSFKRTTTKKLKHLIIASGMLGDRAESETELLDSIETDFYASILYYAEDEAVDDLFEDDNDSMFEESESEMDMFEEEEIDVSDFTRNGRGDLESAFEAADIDIADRPEVSMSCEMEQHDDDMLSICDSLGSLPLSEHCFDDYDISNAPVSELGHLEEICI